MPPSRLRSRGHRSAGRPRSYNPRRQYFAGLDLSGFDPKAPPPKTPAFWDIVHISEAPEDAELADVIEKLGNPDTLTIAQLVAAAPAVTAEWLKERKPSKTNEQVGPFEN